MPIDCAVCLTPYNFRAFPVVGKCGHSVCQLCASNLRSRNCPICRARGAFSGPGTNYRACELIQEIMIRTDADRVLVDRLNRAQESIRRTKEIVDQMKQQYEPQEEEDSDSDSGWDESRDEDNFDRLMAAVRNEEMNRRHLLQPGGDSLIRVRRRYQPTAPWMAGHQDRRGRQEQGREGDRPQNIHPGWPVQPAPQNYGQINALAHLVQVAPAPWYIAPDGSIGHSAVAPSYQLVPRIVQQQPAIPTYPLAVHQYNPMNLVPFPFYPPQQ